jgi:hypothetical protein
MWYATQGLLYPVTYIDLHRIKVLRAAMFGFSFDCLKNEYGGGREGEGEGLDSSRQQHLENVEHGVGRRKDIG